VEVTVIASDELRLHHARVADMAPDPEAAGRALGGALKPHFGADAVALLFYGDAFTLNYTAVKKGIDEALGIDRFIPALGGGANNDVSSTRTYQFHDDDIFEKGACCALLSGGGSVVTMVSHGCYPLGLVQTVTSSTGNMIHALDGVPALDVIKKYVTEEEQQNWLYTVNNLCLGLEVPEQLVGEYDRLCIRYMVGRDPDKGSVMIQTEAPEGTRIFLARRDVDRICQDADRGAARLRALLGDRRPKLVMHFECTGRGKLLLREQVKQDLIRRLQQGAPESVPWMGAYVGGEIGPVGETNMFHNYTAVVAAVL
jgi:small ligand-binding sensory domain FIST